MKSWILQGAASLKFRSFRFKVYQFRSRLISVKWHPGLIYALIQFVNRTLVPMRGWGRAVWLIKRRGVRGEGRNGRTPSRFCLHCFSNLFIYLFDQETKLLSCTNVRANFKCIDACIIYWIYIYTYMSFIWHYLPYNELVFWGPCLYHFVHPILSRYND